MLNLLKNNSQKMTLKQIKAKAKDLGIQPGKMKKAELIHTIQRTEGNIACFGQSGGSCPNTDCCFMDDCLKIG